MTIATAGTQPEARRKYWKRDLSSRAAYEKSVEPNRDKVKAFPLKPAYTAAMRTHLSRKSVSELDSNTERTEVGGSELAPANTEPCLATILDRRINRGVVPENCRVVNGTKCMVYRNFLP